MQIPLFDDGVGTQFKGLLHETIKHETTRIKLTDLNKLFCSKLILNVKNYFFFNCLLQLLYDLGFVG